MSLTPEKLQKNFNGKIIILIIVGILIISSIFYLLTANSNFDKLSENELEIIKNDYINSVESLCAEYELFDCNVDIGEFTRLSSGTYTIEIELNTSEYKSLLGIQAYSFTKKYESLEDDIEIPITSNIIFKTTLISKNKEYKIDTKQSNGTTIYYLMRDDEVVFTRKNGTTMYDIF